MEPDGPCIEVTTAELPLACPLPQQALWNAHPRVYLPIEATGQVICPYCNTHYTLLHADGREPT